MSSTRTFSDLQEMQITKKLNGVIQPNSGGTKFGGGDVIVGDFLIEAKTSTKPKQSFTIKKEWLEKAGEQAFEQGKSHYALAFRFNPDENQDYYIIDEKEFKEYLDYIERMNNVISD